MYSSDVDPFKGKFFWPEFPLEAIPQLRGMNLILYVLDNGQTVGSICCL